MLTGKLLFSALNTERFFCYNTRTINTFYAGNLYPSSLARSIIKIYNFKENNLSRIGYIFSEIFCEKTNWAVCHLDSILITKTYDFSLRKRLITKSLDVSNEYDIEIDMKM